MKQRLNRPSTASRFTGILLVASVAANALWSAAPLVGTKIGNQASATYTDQSDTPRETTSNTVTTTVLQVPGLTLTQDNTRTVSPGGSIFFPHTLTNTGNGTDSFDLFTDNVAGDFSLSSVLIYADTNQDGQPDDITSPITNTGELAPAEQFFFVVGASTPGSAANGETATLDINARSDFSETLDGADPLLNLTADNTDTAKASTNAVITVNKSIDQATGKPGTTPITYTLTYTNTGNATATDVTLEDTIPVNMTYIDDSGRSTLTGASTELTDDPLDAAQGTSPNTVDYGYDVAGRKLTVVLAEVAAGQSGSITFQVSVDATIKPQIIENIAYYSYDPDGPGGDDPETDIPTNKPPFEVLPVPSVTLGNDTEPSANPGQTVTFTNLLTNTGTETDTFDLTVDSSTFPTGTTFKFFYSDGATPMVDSNGNGTPDTGPVPGVVDGGNTYDVIVKAVLPTEIDTATFVPPYVLTKRATGTIIDSDSGLPATDPGTDTLTAIAPPAVDLTNATAAQDPDAGAADGTLDNDGADYTADPGTTLIIPLTVENEGSITDAYNLTVDGGTIPAGWTIVLRQSAGGPVVSNSGTLQPPSGDDGESFSYVAEVTIPDGESPGDYDLTFRAVSPTSGTTDYLVNTVSVNTVREIGLASDSTGQVFPGGSIVYSHILTNRGNVPEAVAGTSPISFSLVNAKAAEGWTSVLYVDVNDDGALDAGDPIITGLPDAGAAGITQLAATGSAGDSVRLFVKIFAPLGAPNSAIDVATLTATPSGTISGVAAPTAVVNVDTTTVVLGDLTLVKEQAVDADNDGVADGAYTALDQEAKPGESILYQITVTNSGSTDATSIEVFDSTPTATSYAEGNGSDAVAQVSGGSVDSVDTKPADGAKGAFAFDVGTLAPGESAVIKFGVTIDE